MELCAELLHSGSESRRHICLRSNLPGVSVLEIWENEILGRRSLLGDIIFFS